MKKAFGIAILLMLMVVGCKNNVLTTGTSILPEEDRILVNTDTFSLRSDLMQADYIYSAPDSFLIGEADSKFGTVHADLLTQLACPLGFEYPQNSVADSAFIYLYFTSYYGDGQTPLMLTVYEMDKGTFRYTDPYRSDIDIDDYCSLDPSTRMLNDDYLIVADGVEDSVYSSATGRYAYYLRLPLTDDYVQRMFDARDFSSQEAFNKVFGGLYITSTFGGATILHIAQVTLDLHYHYTYARAGVDTTVSTLKTFYANQEVRQVNRVVYPALNYEELLEDNDSVNYVLAPAGLYTRLSFPMSFMAQTITDYLDENSPKVAKRAYVNRSLLTVDAVYAYKTRSQQTREDWALPAPYMMLIREDEADQFFYEHKTPNDTCAIVCQLKQGTDTVGNATYYYTFDLAELLTQQLRKSDQPDTLKMVLVPVSASVSSSSTALYYTSVKPLQTVSATTIRSAQSVDKKMTMEVVYSGF